MAGYTHILATTDFSEASLAAADHAVALARRLGSHVTLVFVVQDRLPPMVTAVSDETPEQIVDRHVRTARENLASLASERYPDLEVRTEVLVGTPYAAIVGHAEASDADLIVVGTRGHGLLGQALLGSTAGRVLHHASCPVLVVRHPD